ncbi:UPF0182 family protein [Dehalobacterium formicoaceticum]|uniref:UPF0182 protein NVS47_08055 n=1 Tax=Dehalobacterium formicoaceticum TaxID=51515 RepID=A0ABT1Y6C9_9FIRM|nr:UPF0182 family protein [Dehalobacterium formicoaceticum]MCR6545469.1 UPF0182 family protein [Dehalobacterium formicoaceticum]
MKKFNLLHIFAILILLLAAIKITSGFYVDYLWFDDLGYRQLFTTPIIAKLLIGVLSFIIFFLILFGMGFITYKTYQGANQEHPGFWSRFPSFFKKQHNENGTIDITPPVNKKFVILIIFLASLFLSLMLALQTVQSGWMQLLQFFNATPFGETDPIFNMDISFFVFKMPFYSFVLNSLTSSLTLILLAGVFFFSFSGLIRIKGNIFKRGSLLIPRSIRRFWSILIGVLFILFALQRIIAMFGVVYAQTGYVYGAGYSDVHVTIPLSIALAVVALICGVASFIFFFKNDHRLLTRPILFYLLVGIAGTGVLGLVQYTVNNNEFVREKPYIEREIKYTRMAYGLEDVIDKEYPGTETITWEHIQNNRSTIENVRLNDPRPLKTVLSQNQGLRYYYYFNDIDIDRYLIDDKYRQVFLSTREISQKSLTEEDAGTFVNLTMKFTHGYGLSATLANEIDESGYARLIVKNIPPQSLVQGIDIQEPRIYFGELTTDPQYGYVIGNTAAKEFDYPEGNSNVENVYQGSTGLEMAGINKLFLSAYFNTPRFYIAREINNDSKLLMRRNIVERVSTLMPYLKYDQDPYIVVGEDGKLYWMLDAYSHSNRFPYSAPAGDVNYIRNSVKVVIDAYHGTVDFYAFDPDDPVLKTVSAIFPGVFKDADTMPDFLKTHIRYPEDLFNIQSRILLNFHVTNPSVFYNREDTWDIAKKVDGAETSSTEPYYSVMKLPDEAESEFVLTLPFTPASREDRDRNNMVAWLAARNDGKNYGQLVLYHMPKNVEVQGPLMIDSMIDQNTTIAGKLTLWGQGGSEIIRGNLMTVPIDGGFIYVEPIYIKAAQQGTSIPQMQAIVFAVDKKIIMVETNSLDEAIREFFGQKGLPEEPAPGTPEPDQGKPGEPQVVQPKESILKKLEILKQQIIELEEEIKSM